MVFDFGYADFKPGDFVVYANGGDSHIGPVEIGVVKKVCDDGCFVAYHLGDTCAKTPFWCLLPIRNGYAARGLLERSEQLGIVYDGLSEGCETWGR